MVERADEQKDRPDRCGPHEHARVPLESNVGHGDTLLRVCMRFRARSGG